MSSEPGAGQAKKHIDELNALLNKKRPFVFIVRTNTKSRERFLSVKRDKAMIADIALICGDVVHNLRSALDHICWEIISPLMKGLSDDELRPIQFPFARKANGLGSAIKNRHANRAGTGFICALWKLKPYEDGGHKLLGLVHVLDILDKHKLLIPAIGHTTVTEPRLIRAIPDFPRREMASYTFSGFAGTLRWTANSDVPREQLGSLIMGATHIFEREVDLPTEVVFQVGNSGMGPYPVIRTLNAMADATRETIPLLREAAASY